MIQEATQPITTPQAEPVQPPPERLSAEEVRQGLRVSVWEGAVATVHMSITGSAGGSVFLTGFALLLGANDFQIGLLGSLPFVGQLAQFLGAYLEERAGNRRKIVLLGSLIGRLVWALLLALPFLTFLNGQQLWVFFVGLTISYAFNGIGGNAWLSWMSDLVPPRQRGSYFGMRNMIISVSTMISVFLAGQALDHYTNQGQEAVGYALIFGVALISAIGAAVLVSKQAEPPLKPKAKTDLRQMFRGPLQDIPFRNYVFAATGWAFVTGIAAPFFNAFGLNNLQLSFSVLAAQGIVTSAVALVTTPFLGRLMDKMGYRKVTLACVYGTVLLPFGWAFSTPDNIVPLWINSILSGVFWPGVNLGLGNILMERAPADRRGAAMAMHSAVTGFGTLSAGIIGGLIATGFASLNYQFGPLLLNNLVLLFLLTSLGRGIVAYVFRKTL